MVVPSGHGFSRKDLDALEKYVRQMGAKGLARAKVDGEGNWLQSPLAKMVTPEFRKAVNESGRRQRRRPDLLPVRPRRRRSIR